MLLRQLHIDLERALARAMADLAEDPFSVWGENVGLLLKTLRCSNLFIGSLRMLLRQLHIDLERALSGVMADMSDGPFYEPGQGT